MLEKHQKWYELENVMGGIFDLRKEAVKILWESEEGEAFKWSLGTQKFRKSGDLTRKRNRMAPKMGILTRFKQLKHTTNYVDPESEENGFKTSLGVELLAWKDGFRRKSLEFIVRSTLVRNDRSLALWKGLVV